MICTNSKIKHNFFIIEYDHMLLRLFSEQSSIEQTFYFVQLDIS